MYHGATFGSKWGGVSGDHPSSGAPALVLAAHAQIKTSGIEDPLFIMIATLMPSYIARFIVARLRVAGEFTTCCIPMWAMGCLPLISVLFVLSCGKDVSVPTAADPKADQVTLEVVRTSGVAGTPLAGKKSLPRGAAVDYAFTASPGFDHLHVSIDGAEVAAAGRVTVSASRQIVVAADSTIVATPTQDLLSDAYRAMIAGSANDLASNLSRVRELTNRLYVEVGQAVAATRVSLARQSAIGSSNAATVIDFRKVLSDSLFHAVSENDGSNATASAFLTSPSSPAVAARSRSPFSATNAPITTFIFVNGVLNGPEEFYETVDDAFKPAMAAAGYGVDGVRFRERSFYNRSDVSNVALVKCFVDAATDFMTSQFTAVIDLSVCITAKGVTGLAGALQVMIQALNSVLGTVSPLAQLDSQVLSTRIDNLLADGGRVILVPHSQGNLFVNEALGLLPAADDRGCIAVVGLAPPLARANATGLAYSRSVIIVDPPAADLLVLLRSSADLAG